MADVSEDFLTDNIIKDEIDRIKIKDKATINIEKAELPRPGRPKEFLDFPSDITEIPSQDLGKYLAIYQAFASWTRYLISRREVDLKHGKLLLKFVYAKLYSQCTGKNKKIEIDNDEFYLRAELDIIEIESDIAQFSSILESYKEYSSSISREISNRKSLGESMPQGRVDNTLKDGVFGDGKFS